MQLRPIVTVIGYLFENLSNCLVNWFTFTGVGLGMTKSFHHTTLNCSQNISASYRSILLRRYSI